MKKILISLFLLLAPFSAFADINYGNYGDTQGRLTPTFSVDYGDKIRLFNTYYNGARVYSEDGQLVTSYVQGVNSIIDTIFIKLINGDVIFMGTNGGGSVGAKPYLYYYNNITDSIYIQQMATPSSYSSNCSYGLRTGIADNTLYISMRKEGAYSGGCTSGEGTLYELDLSTQVTASNFLTVNTSTLGNADLIHTRGDFILYQLTSNTLSYNTASKVSSIQCFTELNGYCNNFDHIEYTDGSTISSYFFSSNQIDNNLLSVEYSDSISTARQQFHIFLNTDNEPAIENEYIYKIDWDTGEYKFFTEDLVNGFDNLPDTNPQIMLFPTSNSGSIDFYYPVGNEKWVDTSNIPTTDFVSNLNGGGGGLDNGTGSTTDPQDWTFSVGGYTFYESGFILNNFLPDPYGGLLYFDIIQPGSTTPIRTEGVGSYEIDGNGYGFDSGVSISYPYHPEAGGYQVRVVYKYNGIYVFPFGEDYNTYIISLPEIVGANPDDLLEWDSQACNDGNQDDGFLPGVSNFFLCASQFLGNIFSAIPDFMYAIRDIFSTLSKLGDVDSKELGTFNFIPSANALITETIFENASTGNVKEEKDIVGFIYALIYWGAIIVTIFSILALLNKNNENNS